MSIYVLYINLALTDSFKDVSSEVYKDKSIHGTFIAGISSQYIRLRMLENKMLMLSAAADQARALELTCKDAQSYSRLSDECTPAATMKSLPELNYPIPIKEKHETPDATDDDLIVLAIKEKCFFCGNKHHPRHKCSAKGVTCQKCNKL